MINNVLTYRNGNPFLSKKNQSKPIYFGRGLNGLPKKTLKIADAVSIAHLEEYLNKLAGPETEGRGVGQKGIEIAKNYIAEKFKQFGLQPVEELGQKDYFQNFLTNPYTTKTSFEHNIAKGEICTWNSNLKVMTSNVLGMIKGSESPDEFLVISAHYDHLGKDAKTNKYYPGADDNASGVAAVMEIARIMKEGFAPKKSVIFAALSGEESVFQGADFLSKKLIEKNIASKTEVLNIEMIGGIGGTKLDIWDQGNIKAKNLINGIKKAGEFINTKTDVFHGISPNSDAQQFNARQIPAVCVAWDFYLSKNHPYYHTANDTVERVNKNVLKEAVRTIASASYLLSNKASDKKRHLISHELEKIA